MFHVNKMYGALMVAGCLCISSASMAADRPFHKDFEALSMELREAAAFQSERSKVDFDKDRGLTYRFMGEFEKDGALQLFVHGKAERFSAEEGAQLSSKAGVQYKLRF